MAKQTSVGGTSMIFKRAGHGVLAADGGDAQLQLGVQRAQQGGEGLAPALGSVAQLLEVLLEGEVGVLWWKHRRPPAWPRVSTTAM